MIASTGVLGAVFAERMRQIKKWGEQHHPDGTGGILARESADRARMVCDAKHAQSNGTWNDILSEEFFEAMAESDQTKLREELIHVAAVACAWVEDIDSREAM